MSINANAKQSILFEIFKIIKACIIGYFFIKTIFYYISIFAPINRILFMIFLFLFIIIGGVGEYFLKNKFKTDQILFITSSILAGSMFITKGIGYILGGYFSDGMTSHFELKYGSDAKLRVTFFLVFHIILIAGGFLYQIMDYKARIPHVKIKYILLIVLATILFALAVIALIGYKVRTKLDVLNNKHLFLFSIIIMTKYLLIIKSFISTKFFIVIFPITS